MKRKRGRPKTKVRNSPTKQLTSSTKKKISDSSRRFSICKLCSKQCRGFRGLVDHMHRDHQDYKPWRCHLCRERTTFVKTLYRHLKQEHGTKESPCPVCGKRFRRAQSMLLHANKVRTLNQLQTSQSNSPSQHDRDSDKEASSNTSTPSNTDNQLFQEIETSDFIKTYLGEEMSPTGPSKGPQCHPLGYHTQKKDSVIHFYRKF